MNVPSGEPLWFQIVFSSWKEIEEEREIGSNIEKEFEDLWNDQLTAKKSVFPTCVVRKEKNVDISRAGKV